MELLPNSIIVVHDARSRGCDRVLGRLAALLNADASELEVVVSAQGAAEVLRAASRGEVDLRVAIVCLDLQPAPRAGSRIAEYALSQGIPVVLVTRSTRWLPEGSPLSAAPWISPDADDSQIAAAIRAALALDTRDSGDMDDLDRVSIGF